MEKISLQKATLHDLDKVAALEKEADSKTYSALTVRSELQDFIKNESVYLIKRQDLVVGLVAYKVLKGNIAHFDGLIVRPKLRRQNIATQAMARLLKGMAKYARIELGVHPHNNPALCLYLKLGFIIQSWRDNYFGDGEPRLILVKK
ncbi:MAG: GNAT family N-acetyltransferase [Patescibacteria group bacterium]